MTRYHTSHYGDSTERDARTVNGGSAVEAGKIIEIALIPNHKTKVIARDIKRGAQAEYREKQSRNKEPLPADRAQEQHSDQERKEIEDIGSGHADGALPRLMFRVWTYATKSPFQN